MVTTTIIIPIRVSNSIYEVYLKNLEFSLAAASKQSIPCELILVDYGSHLDYIQKIQHMAFQVQFKYVRGEGSIWSRSKALNIGINNASGDYVLFVDADCVIPTMYASECSQLCGPSTFTISTYYDALPKTASTGNYAQLFQDIIAQGVKDTRYCGFSHICARRDWFIGSGGFNEEYSGWGAEDDEVNLRLKRSGYKERYTEVHPIHLWHPTYEQLMTQEGQKDLYDKLLQENRTRYYKLRDEK